MGRAKVGPMHSKESKVFHDQESILKDILNPLQLIRYYSLAAKSDILPQELKISGTADDGTIMGVRHKDYPVEGLQFHPESIKIKLYGMQIL
ncbi:MAG: gamma-glutamyl-gamma-aminobutyrate hydrolase family protein [Promethearchaeota archaeon]